MYSNQSDYEYGQRRSYSSRDSRPWDEDAKRDNWAEPSRNSAHDSYKEYSEDGNTRVERVSNRSHNKAYTREDTSNRDWRRKRTSSTERTASEKKRRTFGDEDRHRSEAESADSYRQSPEHYSSHAPRNSDFKHRTSVEEGYSRKRTPEKSSRYSQRQDDYHYDQYKEESHYRTTTEYRDRDSRERSWEQDRTTSREDFDKGYTPPRQRRGSFSRDHEDHNHNRFPLNGSSRQTETSNRRLSPPPIPPPPPRSTREKEKAMSTGFQRFLNVLNMGVNMETLTKIVNQGSPERNARQPSPTPQYGDRPWTSESPQTTRLWPESESKPKPRFSPPSRSYSSNGKTLSEERFEDNRHFEKKYPEKRSASPARKSSGFEDDSKCRQMRDVLQAMGSS
ncbi:hypothetical protein WMY93_007139 [Mugilogobius chulae]|uniref:Uncharacterized protein n=1 Tax=Mugilogobius chulae TaxID=88201 RepID=A0AAW0PXD5_9GOBI